MIGWPNVAMHLHREPIDFRKSINGLVVIVEANMNKSAFEPALYIFGNQQRNKIKILYWDSTGFCLWYKRLEQDKFKWPKQKDANVIDLNPEQFAWLLRGLDLEKLTPHTAKKYSQIY
jgi:transposase